MRSLGALILLTAALCAQQQRVIRFDLGPQDQRAQGAWNHLNRAETGGVVVNEAVDALGRRTALRVRQVDGWSGFNRDGAREGGPWSSAATGDSVYLGDHGDRRAELRFENLEPSGVYDLVLYASRRGDRAARRTRFRAGGKTDTLDVQENVIGTADLEDVRADERGQLRLEIELPKGQTYAYLGVIELRGRFADAGTVREPPASEDAPPATTARGWAVADGRTGKVLFRGFADTPYQMASTTKIMTAWIVLSLADKTPELMDAVVTVSATADATMGSTAKIRVGDRVPVRELLYGLLLPSGNDAAVALAEHVGGRLPVGPSGSKPVERFVDEMNRRARTLGMTQTRFHDPHGNSKNRASASDLVRLTWTAMQDPLFRHYVGTRMRTFEAVGTGGRKRTFEWRSTNRLLALEGCNGVKTGTTRGAGACLVASVERGDEHFLVVVLGASGDTARYADAKNLLRWARRQSEGGR